VLFKVDQNTGHLTPMGKMVHVEAPVCLSGFLPLN
jgi:6-phosphogluconolactonase (cycloisomerase 2 family)